MAKQTLVIYFLHVSDVFLEPVISQGPVMVAMGLQLRYLLQYVDIALVFSLVFELGQLLLEGFALLFVLVVFESD